MGRQHETRKEQKRKPAKSIKEKRAAKRAKKEEQASHRVVPQTKPASE